MNNPVWLYWCYFRRGIFHIEGLGSYVWRLCLCPMRSQSNLRKHEHIQIVNYPLFLSPWFPALKAAFKCPSDAAFESHEAQTFYFIHADAQSSSQSSKQRENACHSFCLSATECQTPTGKSPPRLHRVDVAAKEPPKNNSNTTEVPMKPGLPLERHLRQSNASNHKLIFSKTETHRTSWIISRAHTDQRVHR